MATRSDAARSAGDRDRDRELRAELVSLLRGGNAHGGFDRAVAGWPPEVRGVRPRGLPHSAWELVEHLRLAQVDILEFCREPGYREREFPAGYWPPGPEPGRGAFARSLRAFRRDLAEMVELIEDPRLGPFASVAAGTGATLMHEALILADHNAYHVGQLIVLRRALGAWPES